MPKLISVILDVTRFGLACLVAYGHLTQSYFQHGWPNRIGYAVQAVGGFFVLSGFVIRALTKNTQESGFDFLNYLSGRLTRLWSVALPAVVLTVFCDLMVSTAAPAFYQAWAWQSTFPIARILVNILFIAEPYGHDAILFSNSPFWSLSYEFAFYVIWGMWLIADRSKTSLLLLIFAAVLAGPNILLMMPLWLLGVLLYDLTSAPFISAKLDYWIVAFTLSVLAYVALFARIGHDINVALTYYIDQFFAAIGLTSARCNGELVTGAVGGFLLLGMLLLMAARLGPMVRVPAAVVRAARLLGESTFPLYLFHFPLLLVASGFNLYDQGSDYAKLGLYCSVVALSIGAVPLTTRFKYLLRDWFGRALSEITFKQRKIELEP